MPERSAAVLETTGTRLTNTDAIATMMCVGPNATVMVVSAIGSHRTRSRGMSVCRGESAHAKRDKQLTVLVRASFEASKGRYGSPRIYKDLQEQQEPTSRKRVMANDIGCR
jgi:hypothetical protein